ncbi:MbtH family protein [Tundrisphaera sp. TA3]|uniref:MbtH family protein n=1 Tax=Tundrisphaera sp. TA3 TaxID=3435775 RepID=UPI003EBE8F38
MTTDHPASAAPTHKVVVNEEGQYSLWFLDRENPAGWADAGKVGTKEECLEYVEATWTDMTPASLRRKAGDDA